MQPTDWVLGTLTQLKENVIYGNPGLTWLQLSGASTLKSDIKTLLWDKKPAVH